MVDSEERAQLISRARTSNSEAHRRAAIASMLSEQAGREASAADAQGGDAPAQQRTLPLIIKADVQGSAEAVRDAVAHMATEAVRVQVVHVGVGPVSISDIQLATPLGAKVLGFNVRPAGADVEAAAKREGVEVRACCRWACCRGLPGVWAQCAAGLSAAPRCPSSPLRLCRRAPCPRRCGASA